MNGRVVFQYLVPIVVEVVDGLVTSVTIIDSAPIADPVIVEGEERSLTAAVEAAEDGQAWPSWEFE